MTTSVQIDRKAVAKELQEVEKRLASFPAETARYWPTPSDFYELDRRKQSLQSELISSAPEEITSFIRYLNRELESLRGREIEKVFENNVVVKSSWPSILKGVETIRELTQRAESLKLLADDPAAELARLKSEIPTTFEPVDVREKEVKP
jgi:hypothetical protein